MASIHYSLAYTVSIFLCHITSWMASKMLCQMRSNFLFRQYLLITHGEAGGGALLVDSLSYADYLSIAVFYRIAHDAAGTVAGQLIH